MIKMRLLLLHVLTLSVKRYQFFVSTFLRSLRQYEATTLLASEAALTSLDSLMGRRMFLPNML